MNDTASPQTAKRESLESLRQRFQQVPKKKNWNLHKDSMHRLYVTERQTLNRTMEIMKQRFGFVASVRAYKLHFDEWGLEKNLTDKRYRKRILARERERARAQKQEKESKATCEL
ncbi:hypothetical protein BDZ45DRAFT_680286 [Acephala macrosclerotiorum]|nr:hypothetical protein BDZ45DRAFT_680286 [Acephala macrosclerotiorum]